MVGVRFPRCWLKWLAAASLGLLALDAGAQTRLPPYRPPPDPVLSEVEAAAERINRGQRSAGIRDIHAILKRHPNHRQALEVLGQVYLQERRRREAEEVLARCIKKHPASSRCRTFKARLLLDDGHLEAAEDMLKKAVEANSADAEAHLYLGVAYLRQNQLDRAEVELNHALAYRKPGKLTHVHLHLAALYDRQKRPEQAAQQLEWYLRENPDAINAEQLRNRIAQLRASPE